MTTVLTPTIPFTVSLPGDHIYPGQSIVVVGEPTISCNRFCINLIKNVTSHCLFHFDIRFDQGQTVRNCNYPNGGWQHEERSALTLQQGRSFYMEIKCFHDRIQIMIDGHHHCDFGHRAPMLDADALQIQGDVSVKFVQFRMA